MLGMMTHQVQVLKGVMQLPQDVSSQLALSLNTQMQANSYTDTFLLKDTMQSAVKKEERKGEKRK